MRVALVHDVLNQLGGAERVLDSLLEIWPDAVIHTVFYDEAKTDGRYEKYSKRLHWLNKFRMARRHPKLAMPLLPFAFRSFDFSTFDLVFSDSSAFAKFAKSRGILHVCYCHTPARFLWTDTNYIDSQPYPFFLRWAGKLAMPVIRAMDYQAAQEIDYFITNSRNVQERIRKHYGRESEVIPPPVDTEFFQPGGERGDYYLAASRIEPYKRMDLVVEAFNMLGWKLKVAGDGSGLAALKAMARPNIEFLGKVSDGELKSLYAGAKAFVFPAEEDAGIMVLEAQACGTPVIAYGSGGSLETIQPDVTGEFFTRQSVDAIMSALQNFDPNRYDAAAIRRHALVYGKQIFKDRIRKFIEGKMAEAKKT